MTINLHNGGSCHNEALDDTTVEFPQINPVYNSLRHRYSYMPAKTHSEHGYNTLLQYDRNTATFNSHDFGPNTFLDEAVFAPRANARDEKDGYVMLFVYQTQTNTSEFVILDGNHIDHEPIARIHMPRRVPHGLHGSWLPDE